MERVAGSSRTSDCGPAERQMAEADDLSAVAPDPEAESWVALVSDPGVGDTKLALGTGELWM